MDAVDFLIRQHREMEKAMSHVLESREAERKAAFAKVADHLTMHIESEEQVFYPAVKAQRTEDILLESLEEHLSLKRLMADLLELDASEQTFEPKFKVLKEQAEHHHKEEEEHLFPKVKKNLAPSEREKIGQQMLDLQEKLRSDGQPRELVADQTDAAAPLA
jgi:hemerythrin superfamily protein